MRLRTKLGVLFIFAMAFAFGSVGCGDDDDENDASTGSVSASDLARYQENLDRWYKGTNYPPEGPPVKPASGKNIWLIAIDNSLEVQQLENEAVQEAADKLGWRLHIVNGKSQTSEQLTGVQQAIADNADAIMLSYIDCGPLTSGIKQAHAKGIKVIGIESRPCEDPELIDWNLTYNGGLDFQSWLRDQYGAAQGDWIVAKTKGQAKAIMLHQTDSLAAELPYIGARAAIEKCKTCEIVEVVDFVGTDLGPPLQQKVAQALNSNPDANAITYPYDQVATGGGVSAAVRASGREIFAAGGEGSVPGIKLIREGNAGMDMCTGYASGWEGLMAVDAAIRLFAGRDPGELDSGSGTQACDKDHNLPPDGQSFQAGLTIPYTQTFYEMWGIE
jgi:ribose transport system substrate-binding protein